MRVYLLDGSTAVTGALVSAREIARALDTDSEVFLAVSYNAELPVEILAEFAAVRRLSIRPLRRNLIAILAYVPFLMVSAIQLRYQMWRDQADCLIVNDFYLVQGAAQRLLGFKGRIVTWVRIDPAVFGRVSRLWLWAAKRSSDRIVAVSNHIKNLLPRDFFPATIYDSINIEDINSYGKCGPPELTFVFVGNYIRGKGQDCAIAALSLVVQRFPECRIEFYGGDMGLKKNKEFKRYLEQKVAKLGLSENVFLGDFVSDSKSVLAGKLAALNLSRSESFSWTVLEASGFGLPVIATRSGGPQEIIEDDATGYLIPVDDVEACASAMIRLCSDTKMARTMGEAGRTRVLSKFSREAYRKNLVQLLENYV